MKTFSVSIILLLLCTAPVLCQSDRPLITVTGQAEVRVAPDEVLFTLDVESVDKDMLLAKKKTDDSVREILAVARRNGVNATDVQTSYISVEPKYNTDDLEYEDRSRVKRLFLGYAVSKTTSVRLRDISKFDAMLSDVLKAGVTKVRNMEFRNSEMRAHRDRARTMAIKAAQEKARLLAAEIGQTIGPAFSITEGTVVPYSRVAVQNASTVMSGNMVDSELDSAIAPGLISISAQVTVSFRLQ